MRATPKLFLLAALGLLLPCAAFADLMLFPTRIVFDKQRAAQVELMNQGKTPETYRINLVNRRMGPNGEFIAIEQPGPGEQFADAMLRYSPRQVTLKPGESQVVKVMVRKSENLAEGEYRSHMLFQGMPDASHGTDVEATAEDKTKISIRLTPVYGVSIPIIVRHGNTSVQTKITNVAAQGNGVKLTLSRTGNRSAFGDIIVTGPGSSVAGQLRGIAVLLPLAKRDVVVPLNAAPKGSYTIEYRERAEDGGAVIDKTTVNL